jgi:hypothetical protein
MTMVLNHVRPLFREITFSLPEFAEFYARCHKHDSMERFHYFLRRWQQCGVWVDDCAADAKDFEKQIAGIPRSAADILQKIERGIFQSGKYCARAPGPGDAAHERIVFDKWELSSLANTPDSVVLFGTGNSVVSQLRELLAPLLRVARSLTLIDPDILEESTLADFAQVLVGSSLKTLRIYTPYLSEGERTESTPKHMPYDQLDMRWMTKHTRDMLKAEPYEFKVESVPWLKFCEAAYDRLIGFDVHNYNIPRAFQVGSGFAALSEREPSRRYSVTVSQVSQEDFRRAEDRLRRNVRIIQ